MLDKIAYGGRVGTQEADLARRGDIGEDAGVGGSPSTGKFSMSAKNGKTMKTSDSRGSRNKRRLAGCRQSTPTDHRILALLLRNPVFGDSQIARERFANKLLADRFARPNHKLR